MELHTKIRRSKCPRCDNMVYLDCTDLQNDDEPNSTLYGVQFDLCLKCGYSIGCIEPVTSNKDASQGNGIPRAFSGLSHFKWRNGCMDYLGISDGTIDEVISWFMRILKEHDLDPNGSYLNKWDEKTKTILRINPNQNL